VATAKRLTSIILPPYARTVVRQTRDLRNVSGLRRPTARTGLWPAGFDSWVPVLFLASGAAGLIYVFIVVVAVFLIGIAGGSLIYERQRDRVPQMATLGALLAAAAGLALLPMIASNTSGALVSAGRGRVHPPRHHDLRLHLPAHGPAVRRQRRAIC
jgi:hypothetical protein